jgi:hypothetical protein
VVKYWEIIADNLSKAGWSWDCVSAVDAYGRTIWIFDAHRDGKWFVVRADEKLTAFLELESAVALVANCLDDQARFFPDLTALNGSESGGGHFPARFFASCRLRNPQSTLAGKRERTPVP